MTSAPGVAQHAGQAEDRAGVEPAGQADALDVEPGVGRAVAQDGARLGHQGDAVAALLHGRGRLEHPLLAAAPLAQRGDEHDRARRLPGGGRRALGAGWSLRFHAAMLEHRVVRS